MESIGVCGTYRILSRAHDSRRAGACSPAYWTAFSKQTDRVPSSFGSMPPCSVDATSAPRRRMANGECEAASGARRMPEDNAMLSDSSRREIVLRCGSRGPHLYLHHHRWVTDGDDNTRDACGCVSRRKGGSSRARGVMLPRRGAWFARQNGPSYWQSTH
jgi:hypothetical protein